MQPTTKHWADELRPGDPPPARSPRCRTPRPADGPDPYGDPDPEWLGIDWRPHLRTADVVGATVNYVEIGEGRRCSWSTASAARGRTGSRTSPTSPSATG